MPIYMKYEGIDGDVTEQGHEKWIAIDSAQLGVGRAISTPTGRGADREASAPSVSELTITKANDKASSALFSASLVGEAKKIQIDFLQAGAGKSAKMDPYLQLELTNTMVSGFSMSSGGDRPQESLSLNFTKIQYKYTGTGADAKGKAPVAVTFDIALSKLS